MATKPRPPTDAPPPDEGELLKSTEVARLLRVHPKQVYRLIDQGMPGRRVGSEWRFLRDEVLAWSAQRERGATPLPSAAPAALVASSIPPPLLAANGDLVIEVLLARLVADHKPLLGFVQADRGSAFDLLASRAILMAGFHGQEPPSHIDASRLARIHLVRREVGLAHPAKRALGGLADLAGKRLATRAPTAGVRAHLDRALTEAGLTLGKLRVKATELGSHREAVCALVRGEVDAALTTEAWAARMGMRFLRLATEPYDLVLHAEHLGLPWSVAVCEVAQSPAFRAALSAIPGYDAGTAGEIRYDFG
jgi:putative molybdopterin biosynthesis protein